MSEVLLESSDELATVTLNRESKLNAINKAMWKSIGDAFVDIAERPGLRCVVLRGAGTRAFSCGADIEEFQHERTGVEQAREYGSLIHRAITAVRECPIPTVTSISGDCVGGGLELAANTDIRICGASSRFGVPIARLGIVVGHSEMTGLLELLGRSRTLEMLLEARLYSATDAHGMGLVSRVVSDDEVQTATSDSVKRIVSGAPLSARWHKKLASQLAAAASVGQSDDDGAYDCFATEDFAIGVKSFLSKTKPVFRGR